MIRRFNFTERKRIDQERVEIEIIESQGDRPAEFIATLHLDGMDLPPNAPVTIEAYRGRAARRFSWGTVSSPKPPLDRLLANIPDNPSFRVKVVAQDDSGVLLAMANRIRPRREEHHGALVWLKESNLGKEVWRLDFGDGNPTLMINRNIPGIETAVLQDRAFRGLVMPEVLRATLVRALIVDDADPDDEGGDWSKLLAFVRSFNGTPLTLPAAGEDERITRVAWIDSMVAAFTQKHFRASDEYAAALARR